MGKFWNKYSKDCKPEKNGRYLVVVNSFGSIKYAYPKIVYFSNNLKQDVDIYYYDGAPKYGFYYSDSEYGDVIIDNERVILWAEIPDYERMIKNGI